MRVTVDNVTRYFVDRTGQKTELILPILGAHFNLGNARVRQRRVHEAIEHYERALSVDPDLTDSYPALVLVLWMTSDRAGAREQIRAGLRHGWSPPDDLVRRLDPEKAR